MSKKMYPDYSQGHSFFAKQFFLDLFWKDNNFIYQI